MITHFAFYFLPITRSPKKLSSLGCTCSGVKSGFDIIELHAAHGYGLNQWLSPITNKRLDKFGGDILGRSLLLRMIALKIKDESFTLLLNIDGNGVAFDSYFKAKISDRVFDEALTCISYEKTQLF